MINQKINLKYDPTADAAYIYLKEIKEAEVKKTIPLTTNEGLPFELFALDFDKNNKLLGLEILNASQHFPKELLDKLKKNT